MRLPCRLRHREPTTCNQVAGTSACRRALAFPASRTCAPGSAEPSEPWPSAVSAVLGYVARCVERRRAPSRASASGAPGPRHPRRHVRRQAARLLRRAGTKGHAIRARSDSPYPHLQRRAKLLGAFRNTTLRRTSERRRRRLLRRGDSAGRAIRMDHRSPSLARAKSLACTPFPESVMWSGMSRALRRPERGRRPGRRSSFMASGPPPSRDDDPESSHGRRISR